MLEDYFVGKNIVYENKVHDVFLNDSKIGEIIKWEKRLGETNYGTVSFMVVYYCIIDGIRYSNGYLSNVVNKLQNIGYVVN